MMNENRNPRFADFEQHVLEEDVTYMPAGQFDELVRTLDEPDDFSGLLAAVQPEVDNIMAFARDDLGLMLYDWHADIIAELLGGSLGGGLCVRYRRGGKTTMAYVINEYLRRNAE